MRNQMNQPSLREIIEKAFAGVLAMAILSYVACGTIAMCAPSLIRFA